MKIPIIKIPKISKIETKRQKMAIFAVSIFFLGAVGAGAYFYSKSESGSVKNGNFFGGPGQGQELNLPERDADIYGIIDSVQGNQVTLLKLDASSMPQMDKGGEQGARPSGTNGDVNSQSRTKNMNSGEGGQNRQNGMGGENSGTRQRTVNGNSMISELKKKSTGTETITVPVGIVMYKNAGMGQWSDATISDLSSNTMVKVWISRGENGMSVAEAVQIMGGGSQK